MQCDNGGVIESPNQNSVCALTISGDVGSQLDKFRILQCDNGGVGGSPNQNPWCTLTMSYLDLKGQNPYIYIYIYNSLFEYAMWHKL